VYVCLCVCVYVCMYGCMDVWMYGCTDVRVYGCMDVWMYGCMDACMHACMYVHTGTTISSALSLDENSGQNIQAVMKWYVKTLDRTSATARH